MPELRHDALTGRLVLLAPGRRARPDTHRDAVAAGAASGASAGGSAGGSARRCPFCPGHEHDTPPEVARIPPGPADTPGWRVRVVPNLYPIVGGEDAQPGATGAHEVAILSPEHDASFGDLDDDQAVDVMTVLRDRARAHAAAGRAHVQLLINQGRAAGASIEHPHAQVVALDFVPPAVTVAVERFASQVADGGLADPVLADRDAARAAGLSVVDGGEVAAWCPVGAAAPFETRIAASGAGARFEDATDGQVLGVALVLRDVLAALGRALDAPGARVPYNVILHNGPAHGDVAYHWWIEVIARTAVVAAFELGTAVLVNTVDPADAARELKRFGVR